MDRIFTVLPCKIRPCLIRFSPQFHDHHPATLCFYLDFLAQSLLNFFQTSYIASYISLTL